MAFSRTLRTAKAEDMTEWGQSRSGRLLQIIRRDMDITADLMRDRIRNEEILALIYKDEDKPGGGSKVSNLRENILNLPYRYMRWMESQLISKKMVVKINRDAGSEQGPGSPSGDETGMWLGIALGRVAYEGGFKREIKALANEVVPRGTSVLAIGYHKNVISRETSDEVGKDAQSVVTDVLGLGDTEAHEGQAHTDISGGLANIAKNPQFQIKAGREGVQKVLERKDAHDIAAYKVAIDNKPILGARPIRNRAWIRKKRVGEDVGWAPWVYDTEDTELWWDRNLSTVAEVKASNLFTEKFKREVKGYDGRDITGVGDRGRTESHYSAGSDARQAQSDGILDEDERVVEWYTVWFRRPDRPDGGIRKIVAPEMPGEFVEADEANPHVGEDGYALIPGFYPFYDFTPIQSSIQTSERTRGIPPMSVGMTQVEKLAEYNRLRQEAALKGATRIHQINGGLENKKDVLDALNQGKIGYAFIADSGLTDINGRMDDAVKTYDFSGKDPEIERAAAKEEADWVKVMGMPPAVLQGMGTAKTATQDQQGIAAGERESGLIVSYFQERMADVLAGIRGLMRGCYDDEDWVEMLGAEYNKETGEMSGGGAYWMQEWQKKSTDYGDEIVVTFGANAQAQAVVERKQLMEAINLELAHVDPVTGLPIYDVGPLIEELHRNLGLGAPKKDASQLQQLQQIALALAAENDKLKAALGAEGDPSGNGQSSPAPGGPNPSEGEGPTQGNLNAGAMRGTVTAGP